MKKIIYILAIAVLATACKKDYSQPSKETESLKKVRVAEVSDLSDAPTLSASGKLASKEEVELSFKTGGILNALKYEEGEQVNKGVVLASLNLSEINAQVQSAKNVYEKAERDYERATLMYQDSVGTLEQQQNRKTALDIAKSQLEIANFNRQYSVITAPFKGTILKKSVEAGQLVTPGQSIFTIGSSGNKGTQIVKIGLSDKAVLQVKPGDSSKVIFDAFASPLGSAQASEEYRGTVTQINEVANTNTGLFEVEVTLDSYEKSLKNGFIATVYINPSHSSEQLRVPMNALVEGQGKKARLYYTLDDILVKETQVDIIDLNDDYFTIQTGALPKNAKIVTEGAPFLKANDSIQIVP